MESRNLSRVPSFDKESGALNIIVEAPKNGRIKYKYSEKHGIFQFDRPCPTAFPFRSNSVLCRRQLAETEIRWMCWFCLMKRRFQDASCWARFWVSCKPNSARGNR